MLNSAEAKELLLAKETSVSIQDYIEYRGLYVFRVLFLNAPGEEDYDPFFSVNQKTGEVRDFSVLTDGNLGEITELFLKKQREV